VRRPGSLPLGRRTRRLEDGFRSGPPRRTQLVELTYSFLVGAPDLRIETRTAAGGPVRVALHGKLNFSDDDFADQIARIAEVQRGFWNDREAAFFVPVVALPPLGAEIGVHGHGPAATPSPCS
jgi:hypothetical protein